MKTKTLKPMLGLLLLGACASQPQISKEELAEYQYLQASNYCEMQAEMGKSTGGFSGFFAMANSQLSFNKVYTACMKFKGYVHGTRFTAITQSN